MKRIRCWLAWTFWFLGDHVFFRLMDYFDSEWADRLFYPPYNFWMILSCNVQGGSTEGPWKAIDPNSDEGWGAS